MTDKPSQGTPDESEIERAERIGRMLRENISRRVGQLPWHVGLDNDRYIRDANNNLVLVLTDGMEDVGKLIVEATTRYPWAAQQPTASEPHEISAEQFNKEYRGHFDHKPPAPSEQEMARCNGPFGDEEDCPVHGAEIRKGRGRARIGGTLGLDGDTKREELVCRRHDVYYDPENKTCVICELRAAIPASAPAGESQCWHKEIDDETGICKYCGAKAAIKLEGLPSPPTKGRSPVDLLPDGNSQTEIAKERGAGESRGLRERLTELASELHADADLILQSCDEKSPIGEPCDGCTWHAIGLDQAADQVESALSQTEDGK